MHEAGRPWLVAFLATVLADQLGDWATHVGLKSTHYEQLSDAVNRVPRPFCFRSVFMRMRVCILFVSCSVGNCAAEEFVNGMHFFFTSRALLAEQYPAF